jgi:hypothetical protein
LEVKCVVKISEIEYTKEIKIRWVRFSKKKLHRWLCSFIGYASISE